jgi:hypothetical protein
VLDTTALVPGTYNTLLTGGGAAATVDISVSGGATSVTDAGGATVPIVGPNNLPASNGIVHALGGLLTPPAP